MDTRIHRGRDDVDWPQTVVLVVAFTVTICLLSCTPLKRERESFVNASDRVAELAVASTNSLVKIDKAVDEAHVALKHTTMALDAVRDTIITNQPEARVLVESVTDLACSYRQLAEVMTLAVEEFRKTQSKTAPHWEAIMKNLSAIFIAIAGAATVFGGWLVKRYVFSDASLPADLQRWQERRIKPSTKGVK